VVTAAGSPVHLASALEGIRLILHVLGAAVWVGGQFTVLALLPTVRQLGDDAPKKVAQAFARLMWPAYGLLLLTGFWNIAASDVSGASSTWKAVLMAKVAVVVLAGVAMFLHQAAGSRRATAIWGAIGALSSVAALCLGVFLAG
jgi:putative copper export protein